MDQKLPTNLDPKLKEAYDRVMSASYKPQPESPNPLPPQQHPQPAEPMAHMDPLPSTAQPVQPVTQHVAQAAPQHHTAQPLPHQATGISSGFVAQKSNGGTHISGKILLIAGFVFFVVYTLFWLKWFGVFA